MKKSIKFTFLCILLAWSNNLLAQLVVNSNNTHFDMVKSLEGAGVKFTNITSSCPGIGQMAQFDATNSNVGMDEGILLTTGSVLEAVGPNDEIGAGEVINSNGDIDLDSIAGINTNDACAIEFDFETAGDSLNFEFVFASEEYPQFVNNINDAFGFFISGPGINGPFDNNAENIALLPDGVTPVSIKNINNGTSNNGPCNNCSFYNANGTGNQGETQFTDPTVVQYDGFTDVITARYPVSPCKVYHLKLVVADAKDKVQDSGVFLKRGSFQSRTANVLTRYKRAYEDCKDNELLLFKSAAQQEVEVRLQYSGTATNGVDYGILNNGVLAPLPDSFLLAANSNLQTLNISIAADAIQEGVETAVILIENSDCFGNFGISDSITMEIHEQLAVSLTGANSACTGDSVQLSVDANEKNVWFEWSPERLDGDSLATNYGIEISNPITYSVTAKDTFGCQGSDTIEINALSNSDQISFTYAQKEMTGATTIKFFPDTLLFSSAAKYFWFFEDSTGATSTELNPEHTFPGPGSYRVVLIIRDNFSDSCDFVIDTLIEIGNLELPNIFTPNGDGINDYFKVDRLYSYQLQLYNRWGQSVYRSEEYMREFDGADLPDGTYFFVITTDSGSVFTNWVQISR